MMSAPLARTSAGFIALTVAAVPTGMKAGVRISPRAMAMTPVRAAPSVAAMVKESGPAIRRLYSITRRTKAAQWDTSRTAAVELRNGGKRHANLSRPADRPCPARRRRSAGEPAILRGGAGCARHPDRGERGGAFLGRRALRLEPRQPGGAGRADRPPPYRLPGE